MKFMIRLKGSNKITEIQLSQVIKVSAIMNAVLTSIGFILCTVATASCCLYFLTLLAPTVPDRDQSALRFPSSLQELQGLAELLQLYYANNPLYVLLLFSCAYIYKQAFIIPGSVLLNILAGALFGTYIGFPLCCMLTASGATCCYLLSRHCASVVVQHFFPEKVSYFQNLVQSNSHQLLHFLLFLRLFPMTPNWLLNLASPIVQVPVHLFFFTVFVGLMPYNFMCVQTGEMLASLHSLDHLFSLQTVLQLGLLALAALFPSVVFRQHVTVSAPKH